MPLLIDVKPYELQGVITSDSHLTHYKAKDSKSDDYIITEFQPTYMVTRNDDNTTLDVSDRFSKEYINDREEFVRRINAFEEMRDSSIYPVVSVIERNNTAYMVRRACNLTPVETYMSGQQMEWLEAYHFVRPLILGMAQAADAGVLFNFSLSDLRVNSQKQLVLTGLISWETDFHPSLVQIARLYYKLVTGVEAAETDAPGFNVFGIDVPPRLESMVMEILTSEILYGSLDDFYRKFKSLVDGSEEAVARSGGLGTKVLKSVIAVLSVVALFALVGLAFGAVEAHRASVAWASPNLFATGDIIQPEYDFTRVTQTHPRDTSDALVGSFIVHEGFLFSRGDGGMMRRRVDGLAVIPGATGIVATAEDSIILAGAKPSFMISHGRYLYFVDSSASNVIYRMLFNGTELQRITDYPALYLATIDNFLFYSNPHHNYHMYRINLDTMESELYLPMQALYTMSDGERLFFLSDVGTDHSGLYVLDPEEAIVRGLVGGVGLGMRIWDDRIFYLDAWGRVRSIDKDGTPLETHAPTNVRSFDVFAQWMVFTEEGRHLPRAYNMNTEAVSTLTSTEWVSYVWMHGGITYAIDHRDPTQIHIFYLH